MSISDNFRSAIAEGHTIRSIDEGIYSVLSERPGAHLYDGRATIYVYDGRATIYDLVVGTRFYNRVMWGASMPDYLTFAKQAVASHPTGMLLDAGCGSLLFTAQAYLDSERPVLACDQSLEMLMRARSSLTKIAGRIPERIFLLQADLNSLPFRPAGFHTALCMNVLHHMASAESFIMGLKRLLVVGGRLYLTSLVKGNRLIGDRYLDILYKRGDFVRPRTGAELKTLLAGSFGENASCCVTGNMAYATAVSSIQ